MSSVFNHRFERRSRTERAKASKRSRWSIEAFVHNLTDQSYLVGAFGAPERTLPSSLDPDKSASNYFAYPSAPRTWGLTLRARY